jgi:hypothetical protein
MAAPNRKKSIKAPKIVQPKFEDSDSDDGVAELDKQPTDYFGLQSSKSFDEDTSIDPEEQREQ